MFVYVTSLTYKKLLWQYFYDKIKQCEKNKIITLVCRVCKTVVAIFLPRQLQIEQENIKLKKQIQKT